MGSHPQPVVRRGPVVINAALGSRNYAAIMLHAPLQQKLQHKRRQRAPGTDPLDTAGRAGNRGKHCISRHSGQSGTSN